MVKKSKKIILFFIMISTIILVIATILKVYTNHIDNSFLVLEKKIEEAAMSCYLDEVCTEDLTLGTLETNGYISKLIDPVSKEYLKDTIKVKCTDSECTAKLR